MPIAARHRNDASPELAALVGLSVVREDDAATLASIQGKSIDEMEARHAVGHRAYVAHYEGAPAAWGWVATRTAEIGEVSARVELRPRERYLWNFVTAPSHRGIGIYPRLLDAIVRAESGDADCFWIVYAPENHASGAGARKAGFVALAELSFDETRNAALQDLVPGGAATAARLLALPEAVSSLAPCWRCVRAGRPVMYCPPGECRCDYQIPHSGCSA